MDEEKDSINRNIKDDDISNQTEEEIKNANDNEEVLDSYNDDNEKICIENEETNDEENENLIKEAKCSKNKRNSIIGIIISVLVLLCIVMYIKTSKYENLVYPNVAVYEEDISKLNEEQLKVKLESITNSIDKNEIYVKANNKEYRLIIKDVVSEYNINQLTDEIMSYGKEGNFVQKFCKMAFGEDIDYKFTINTNDNLIKNFIKDIAEDTNKKLKEPEVIIDGENIKYVEGKDGIKLDENELLSEIQKRIEEDNIYNKDIKINAKYKNESPNISIEDLKKVNSKISTYSTNYGAGGGRGRNIELAAKQLDNMILMPGDEFSYEKALGDITIENGYSYAPVIVNGELKDGVGGGVCQVSSTLYNTQLKAGIVPTERRNHSKAVNYVPRGLDATLATGSIDYKFKNTHNYPIVINTKAGGGTLTIEFWSNEKALNGIEYKAVGYASGNVANTYLNGYDKDGKKVYEKHIDTSVYK